MAWILVEQQRTNGPKRNWSGPHFASFQGNALVVYDVQLKESLGEFNVKGSAPEQFYIDDSPLLHQYQSSAFAVRYRCVRPNGEPLPLKRTRRLVFVGNCVEDKLAWVDAIRKVSKGDDTTKPDVISEASQPQTKCRAHTDNPWIVREGILMSSPVQKLSTATRMTAYSGYFPESSTLGISKQSTTTDTITHKWCMRYVKLMSNGMVQFYNVEKLCSTGLVHAQVFAEERPIPAGAESSLGHSNKVAALIISGGSGVPRNIPMNTNSFKWWKKKSRKQVHNDSLTIGLESELSRRVVAQRVTSYSDWCELACEQDRRVAQHATRVITKGWMLKKGPRYYSRWKKRFFVLLSSKELVYYENDVNGFVKGAINLSSLDSRHVRLVPGTANSPGTSTLEVVTPKRTWYLCDIEKTTDQNKIWADIIVKTSTDSTCVSSASSTTTTFATDDEMNELPSDSSTNSKPEPIIMKCPTLNNLEQELHQLRRELELERNRLEDERVESTGNPAQEEQVESTDSQVESAEIQVKSAANCTQDGQVSPTGSRVHDAEETISKDVSQNYEQCDASHSNYVPGQGAEILKEGVSNGTRINQTLLAQQQPETEISETEGNGVAKSNSENMKHKDMTTSTKHSSSFPNLNSSDTRPEESEAVPSEEFQCLKNENMNHCSSFFDKDAEEGIESVSAERPGVLQKTCSFSAISRRSPDMTTAHSNSSEGNGKRQGLQTHQSRHLSSSTLLQTSKNVDRMVGRTHWQLVSGNLPVECLSMSPYSAKVIAEKITGAPTPRRSIVYTFDQSCSYKV